VNYADKIVCMYVKLHTLINAGINRVASFLLRTGLPIMDKA